MLFAIADVLVELGVVGDRAYRPVLRARAAPLEESGDRVAARVRVRVVVFGTRDLFLGAAFVHGLLQRGAVVPGRGAEQCLAFDQLPAQLVRAGVDGVAQFGEMRWAGLGFGGRVAVGAAGGGEVRAGGPHAGVGLGDAGGQVTGPAGFEVRGPLMVGVAAGGPGCAGVGQFLLRGPQVFLGLGVYRGRGLVRFLDAVFGVGFQDRVLVLDRVVDRGIVCGVGLFQSRASLIQIRVGPVEVLARSDHSRVIGTIGCARMPRPAGTFGGDRTLRGVRVRWVVRALGVGGVFGHIGVVGSARVPRVAGVSGVGRVFGSARVPRGAGAFRVGRVLGVRRVLGLVRVLRGVRAFGIGRGFRAVRVFWAVGVFEVGRVLRVVRAFGGVGGLGSGRMLRGVCVFGGVRVFGGGWVFGVCGLLGLGGLFVFGLDGLQCPAAGVVFLGGVLVFRGGVVEVFAGLEDILVLGVAATDLLLELIAACDLPLVTPAGTRVCGRLQVREPVLERRLVVGLGGAIGLVGGVGVFGWGVPGGGFVGDGFAVVVEVAEVLGAFDVGQVGLQGVGEAVAVRGVGVDVVGEVVQDTVAGPGGPGRVHTQFLERGVGDDGAELGGQIDVAVTVHDQQMPAGVGEPGGDLPTRGVHEFAGGRGVQLALVLDYTVALGELRCEIPGLGDLRSLGRLVGTAGVLGCGEGGLGVDEGVAAWGNHDVGALEHRSMLARVAGQELGQLTQQATDTGDPQEQFLGDGAVPAPDLASTGTLVTRARRCAVRGGAVASGPAARTLTTRARVGMWNTRCDNDLWVVGGSGVVGRVLLDKDLGDAELPEQIGQTVAPETGLGAVAVCEYRAAVLGDQRERVVPAVQVRDGQLSTVVGHRFRDRFGPGPVQGGVVIAQQRRILGVVQRPLPRLEPLPRHRFPLPTERIRLCLSIFPGLHRPLGGRVRHRRGIRHGATVVPGIMLRGCGITLRGS
ncbi:hypothetical protein NRB20_75360 [Nocardia sp. RB20]|uniref:Uncharacterized protein n=1 Tax=Nocardia macrotermitis TaxID=2585198 RepID=A0A7K0DFU0_9NOCA|nr:hypothetical protein [Nocardia macrotermitis]